MRKHINREIFAKPVFEVDFGGKTYQVVCKEKKILAITFVRYQVLGVYSSVLEDNSVDRFKNACLKAAKKFYRGKLYISLYIQFGFVDQIISYGINDYKSDDKQILTRFESEFKHSVDYLQHIGLLPSRKHNLPDSTIVTDLTNSIEELKNDIGRNAKEKIKKAEKQVLNSQFSILNSVDTDVYSEFYNLYRQTADKKGFGAVTQTMRDSLKNDAIKGGYGTLYIIRNSDGDLISGAFCLQDGDNLIYLYGANDRRYGNSGLSQYLHWYIIQSAQQQGLKRYDFLGASRIGVENDRLGKVTQFKMGFGGRKIEYLGSWDFVISKVGYWLYGLF